MATTQDPHTRAGGAYAPQLASDVELIGLFEDSGFKEAPYIARRRDGQVIQLAPMLYALAEELDGSRDTAAVAEALSHRIEREVTPDMVEMLLEEQLRPLGIVAQRDGVTAEVQKLDPLLALKFRTKVVPARAIRALTTVFRPAFLPPVMAVVMLAFVGLDVWLFGVHGISQGLREVLYQPVFLFVLIGGVVVATAFHEIGHATGVRYGGAEPGVMGVGIYIVWPAFYTDITDSYRLGKWGRLRADIGGMYFNAIFALCATGAYAVTGLEPLLLLVVLQNIAILQQSLPFLRLDGYYIVSDLTGVPDILSRIRPVLASLVPGRPADDRVTELKPWVRFVVTGYILVLVPALVAVFAVMLIHAPRMFATAYDSLLVRYDRVGPELGDGRTVQAALDLVQMVMLTLPCLGLIYTTGRIGHRAGRGALTWSAVSRARRLPLMVGTVTTAVIVGFLWWPSGDYRPIQRQERGTLLSGLSSVKDVPSGRASLPVQRELQLGGAPTVRERRRAKDARDSRVGDEPAIALPDAPEKTGGDGAPPATPPPGSSDRPAPEPPPAAPTDPSKLPPGQQPGQPPATDQAPTPTTTTPSRTTATPAPKTP